MTCSAPEGRRAFLNEMLAVAATIPEAAERDQFADRLAHKARVTEGVMRDEIHKAAARTRSGSAGDCRAVVGATAAGRAGVAVGAGASAG